MSHPFLLWVLLDETRGFVPQSAHLPASHAKMAPHVCPRAPGKVGQTSIRNAHTPRHTTKWTKSDVRSESYWSFSVWPPSCPRFSRTRTETRDHSNWRGKQRVKKASSLVDGNDNEISELYYTFSYFSKSLTILCPSQRALATPFLHIFCCTK